MILPRRNVAFRDGLTFLILSAVAAVLFAVTLLLFRSFERHRADLAREWAQQGHQDMQRGQANEAIAALRVSLSYAPDTRENQLLLAEALADAGRVEEARNYFLNLWEVSPGDGFINLQLARLARRKGTAIEATEYYRASIFGSWPGDGVTRRREVRLELASYLIERNELQAARAELLTGAGNADNDPAIDLIFGDELRSAGDLEGAMSSYQRAIDRDPKNGPALGDAAQAAFELGEYEQSYKLTERALQAKETRGAKPVPEARRAELAQLAKDATLAQSLSLSRELPAVERSRHILYAAAVAARRLHDCIAELDAASSHHTAAKTGDGDVPPRGSAEAATPPNAVEIDTALADLETRWNAASPTMKTLKDSADQQDTVAQLIDDTETVTAKRCVVPEHSDDAVLLMLATKSQNGRRR